MKVRFHIESAPLLAACLLLQGSAWAQQTEKATAPAASTTAPSPPARPSKKAVLSDAARASTSRATEGAVKQKVKPAGEPEPGAPEDSAVTEFRPLPPGQESSEQPAAATGTGQKARSGPLKDVHGTVYGGAGVANTGTRTTGAAAGASSRSGKTSVYIEGQRAKETAPRQ